jgi:argininosuccinate lyase
VRKGAASTAASQGYMWATDVADYLVEKDVPFRTAHEITGKLVGYCIQSGKGIKDIEISGLKKFSDRFEKDIYDIITPEAGVNMRRVAGGTATEMVLKRIKEIEENDL